VACFIASQKDAHGIPQAVSCRALGVSQSWFYKWKAGPLPAEIARLFAARGGKDGSPRITAALRDAGWRVPENTVAGLMREQGLAARRKKRRRATKRPGKGRWRAPDQVKRKFGAGGINRRWYGDGTEIVTGEGKLYLDSVLDMGSRRIVGFALGARHDAALAYGALAMAVAVRGGVVPGVVFRTGQGSEYTAGSFRAACQRLGVAQSMGRPGSAPATAGSGSWHSTLEFEFRSLHKFTGRDQARAAAAAWIEDYNHVRRHSALGMRSPVDYERFLAGKDAA
jgi:putative transposase